jgi:hypothetical protein
MRSPARRRRPMLTAMVGCTVLLLGSFGYVQVKAHTAWTAMIVHGHELHRGWQARASQRAPLWGEASDRLAFEQY